MNQSHLKAMILCAGFGTRMKELTAELPKPLLPVNGKPILEHTIENLRRHGIRDIGINLHYKAEKIREFCGSGSKWGVRIHFFDEPQPTGTAGAAKAMESLVEHDDSFLLMYGDILTNQDFTNLVHQHVSASAKLTVVLHQRNRSNSLAVMDENHRITSFLERPPESAFDGKQWVWVNSGIYMVNTSVLKLIPKGQVVDFPKDIFPKLIETHGLYGYPLTGYRYAIDSPERLKQAQEELEVHV